MKLVKDDGGEFDGAGVGDEGYNREGGVPHGRQGPRRVDPGPGKLAKKQVGALKALYNGEDGVADNTVEDPGKEEDDLFDPKWLVRLACGFGGLEVVDERRSTHFQRRCPDGGEVGRETVEMSVRGCPRRRDREYLCVHGEVRRLSVRRVW